MPDDKDKYDDLLAEFDQNEELKANVKEAQSIPETTSPSDLGNSYTPDPRDAGKQDKVGQEATIEESGQTLNNNGVEPVAPETPTGSKEEYQHEDLLEEFENDDTAPAPQEAEQEQDLGR